MGHQPHEGEPQNYLTDTNIKFSPSRYMYDQWSKLNYLGIHLQPLRLMIPVVLKDVASRKTA